MTLSYLELLGTYMHLFLRRSTVTEIGERDKVDGAINQLGEEIKNYPSEKMTSEDHQILEDMTKWLESSFKIDYRKIENLLARDRHNRDE